jgi:AcrR family transcriptional regulator
MLHSSWKAGYDRKVRTRVTITTAIERGTRDDVVQQVQEFSSSRPTPKARATRARLMQSAADAFVEDGFSATSVRAIAERTGMTSGAIYGHFSNKANLLGEVVRAHLTDDLEHRGIYKETDLADWLARNFREYRMRRDLRALIVDGAAAARVDDAARRPLRDVITAKLGEWKDDYRTLWERDRLDPEVDPEAVLLLMFAAEVGFGVLEAIDVDLPRPGVLSTAVQKLIGSLRTRRRRVRVGEA